MTQHEPQLNEKALFPGPRGGEDARLEQGRAQRVEHAERPAAWRPRSRPHDLEGASEVTTPGLASLRFASRFAGLGLMGRGAVPLAA
jgi:hypothetical protein